jgi:3-deoxy-D-manno-octulosonate 8-phosphate phosphatase (KDO 8-P phosphatase)
VENELSEVSSETLQRAGKVRLVLLDVDGVLTDGRIQMSSSGEESRSFYVRDGLGIRLAQRAGLAFGIVSGRKSQLVDQRAAELGITEIHQQVSDKASRFREIVQRLEIPAEAVCFVGDDLIDVPAMRLAGFAAAPVDAAPETLEVAHYVTEREGGRGAVREVVDLVLRASGTWDSAISHCFPA